MSRFCPLLSSKLLAGKPEEIQRNLNNLKFPKLASPKYDGWRIFEYAGEATTRSMKPPKNLHVRAKLRDFYARVKDYCGLVGLDGEVVVGDPTHYNAMQNTTSGVGSYEGMPEFTYFLFDSYQYADQPYEERWTRVRDCLFPSLIPGEFPWVVPVEQVAIHNMEDMLAYEQLQLNLGYEGIMLRDPRGHYKKGRSTVRDGILTAIKRWESDEGIILEIREQMHNANEATINALGHTERSSHQENLIGKNTMGSVLVKSKRFEKPFSVGNGRGLDDALRKYIWEHKEEFLGGTLTYRFQDIGVKERPRFPQWVGMRDPDDMG